MERTFKISPDIATKVIKLAQPPRMIDETHIGVNHQTEVYHGEQFHLSEAQAEKVLSDCKSPIVIQSPQASSKSEKRKS